MTLDRLDWLLPMEPAGMATFKFTGGVSQFRNKLVEGMVANGYEREFAARRASR